MHRSPSSRGPLLLALVACPFWAACLAEPEAVQPLEEAASPELTPTERVLSLLSAGDVEAAHEALDGVLVDLYKEQARSAFTQGQPEDGLVIVDRALVMAPHDEDVLRLKAMGSLSLAEKKIAQGGSAGLIEGALADAAQYFRECPATPEILLGASRTETLLGNYSEALDLAQAANDALLVEPSPGELAFEPEGILSEAAFRAYLQAKQAEEESAAELFVTAEDALSRLLGRRGNDPWAWGTLADLNEWEGRLGEAQATLQRGLERLPDESALLDRLARVSRKSGGSDEVIAVFAAYHKRNPEVPYARWIGALERFESNTAKLMERFDEEADRPETNADMIEGFRRAEHGFRRTREADEAYKAVCKGYEVMCRTATGWAHYQDEELFKARDAFLSTLDVLPRGLEWKIEGRLLSGVDGLHLVGTAFNDREQWYEAARCYAQLNKHQPEESVWANNKGFFFRDAAVEIELLGKRLCRAANGNPPSDETWEAALKELELTPDSDPEAFARASDAMMEKAAELMGKSWLGYREAARLAADDVRIVNDAGLVLVYYLHDNLKEAERLLQSAARLGQEQLQDESLDEDARWELKNAWGDAFQNLGVLYAIHKNDPEQARRYMQRSVEIGPEPRPILSNFWIPLLSGEIQGDRDFELYSLREWGAPCTDR